MTNDELANKVHDSLDNIIINNPGQFPDGPDFISALYAYLNHLITENVIEQWSLHPKSDEGFKLVLCTNNEKVTVLRNSDGGLFS